MRRILVIAILTLVGSMGTACRASAQIKAAVKAQPRAGAPAKAVALSDEALDKVTAGTIAANTSNGVVNFQGSTPTPNGLVASTGSLAIQSGGINSTTNGTLSINGNAQQNLSSLVNLNAVNSKINVLMNLNVNINSTVGTLTQSNLNGRH